MESILRQSRTMCPFLSKTSPATLRSLSTTASSHHVSPGAGSMSNLQVLAKRCPIMGKALAVQSARIGNNALAGAFGGVRAYHTRVNRARLHTSTPKEAQAVEIENLRPNQGTPPRYTAVEPVERAVWCYRREYVINSTAHSSLPARPTQACCDPGNSCQCAPCTTCCTV